LLHPGSDQEAHYDLGSNKLDGVMSAIMSVRQGSDVFETYWTTLRGVEAMNTTTVCWIRPYIGGRKRGGLTSRRAGRFSGKQTFRVDGRPTPQSCASGY